MRISDDERRETVENLRCLSYTNRVRYKEEFYELLDETVMEPDTLSRTKTGAQPALSVDALRCT